MSYYVTVLAWDSRSLASSKNYFLQLSTNQLHFSWPMRAEKSRMEDYSCLGSDSKMATHAFFCLIQPETVNLKASAWWPSELQLSLLWYPFSLQEVQELFPESPSWAILRAYRIQLGFVICQLFSCHPCRWIFRLSSWIFRQFQYWS